MQGRFPDAIHQLQAVVRDFPLSPDARRELGSCYYQTHQYSAALEQYTALQNINPDDLQAHYILSLIYRRIGVNDKAKQEAARFADEQDDQLTDPVILQYLGNTPDASRESEPWHVHVLSRVATSR
jgi:tetratricopeptide (TPR) repeat protein